MATVDDFSLSHLTFSEEATPPSAPAAGSRRMYVDDTGAAWLVDSAGVATLVSAGAISDLTDVDLTGRADGDTLVWDATAGLWVPVGSRTINAQTGTTYTLALSDAGSTRFLTLTNAAATALTVPTNATVAFPVGSVVSLAQLGSGQVTITPASGVTVNAVPGLKIAAQFGVAELLKTATDTWLAYGRLSA